MCRWTSLEVVQVVLAERMSYGYNFLGISLLNCVHCLNKKLLFVNSLQVVSEEQ